jgi:hypothetical protein
MGLSRRSARGRLEAAGYVVFNTRTAGIHAHDGLYTFNNAHFADDPGFRAAYARGVQAGHGVDPHTEWRIHVALWAAGCAARAEGDFIECGVNAGFTSSAIMRHLGWERLPKTFYLIDTFGGPVLSQFSEEEVRLERKKVAEEALARGAYVTDLDRIRANYAEWPNVRIVQGAVPEILEQARVERVAFLHLDMNCAAPERAAFEFFWEKLSPGGMVLFDDYARYAYDYLAATVDEAAAARGASVLSLPTGQGLVWKP